MRRELVGGADGEELRRLRSVPTDEEEGAPLFSWALEASLSLALYVTLWGRGKECDRVFRAREWGLVVGAGGGAVGRRAAKPAPKSLSRASRLSLSLPRSRSRLPPKGPPFFENFGKRLCSTELSERDGARSVQSSLLKPCDLGLSQKTQASRDQKTSASSCRPRRRSKQEGSRASPATRARERHSSTRSSYPRTYSKGHTHTHSQRSER